VSVAIGFDVSTEGFEALQARLARVSSFGFGRLIQGAGALVESQTKRRITREKRDPDGKAWRPWSERYARTRQGGQSLLQSHNHLLQSMQWEAADEGVAVGSNLKYARAQQAGFPARHLPARPYLGISDANEHELLEELNGWLDEWMEGLGSLA
jgi:phage virion morphogenesis protein